MSAALATASRTGRIDTTAVVLAVASASLATGTVLAWLHPSTESVLIAGIAAACVVPIAARLARRRFDIFEPIVVASAALFVMYALRPAAIMTTGVQPSFKGYDIGGTFVEALIVAFAGVAALQLGYAIPWGRNVARRLTGRPGRWDVRTAVAYAMLLALVAIGLYAIFLSQSGGLHVLGEFVEGRSARQDSYFRDSSAYLYAAPQLLWPASLLLFAVGISDSRRDLVALSALLLLPLAVFASGQGSRIVLLPLLLSPAVYLYLARNRRPSPLVLAVAAYLVLTLGIAYFRETRTATVDVSRVAELERAVIHPGYELDQLVRHGTDNDMFESLAVELRIVPEHLPASPPDFVYRTLVKPIPSTLWAGKPVAPEERLTQALYPAEQVRASSSAGFVGSLYLGGALPGVMIGMAALGALLRLPWEYARRFPGRGPPQLLLAVSLMFIPILLRGGIGDTIARALFALVPILIAGRICWRGSIGAGAAAK
jgi:hypothetical protein